MTLKVLNKSIDNEVVKKHKRVSKKTKKSWRKHVDIKDVDKFLDDERLTERLGKPFSERSDTELFIVDSKADNKLVNVFESKSAKRLALRNAEPKYCAILKPHTAVPAMKVNNSKPSSPSTTTKVTKKYRPSDLKKKLKSLKKKDDNGQVFELKKKQNVRGEFVEDPWAKETEGSSPSKAGSSLDCEWFKGDTIRHNKPAKKKIRVRANLTKKVAAVEAPHPGMSYNPSYEDHQQLLHSIAEKEKALMKEEAHLNRVTTQMFKKVSAQEKEKNWLEESSQGLPATERGIKLESEDDDGDGHPDEVRSINPPAKLNKKTKQQRRKQMEQKKLKLEIKMAKIEKKKVGDIYKLKMLKKKIDEKEIEDEKARKIRAINEEKKAGEPKILSKTKYEAPELDFKMGGELSGNLRNADPTGNLLKDRYKSLQQRSIVAPNNTNFKLNKPRVKKFVKADHKITWNGKII